MTNSGVAPIGEQDPSVYRRCFDFAVGEITANFDTFDNKFSVFEATNAGLLTSIATGYLVLGETAKVEAIEEDPLFKEDPSAQFELYVALASEGDEAALEKAKTAGTVAHEGATYLEDVIPLGDIGPLRVTERNITLIRAGAADLIPETRELANQVELRYRTELLGSLYAFGDQESLPLALQAADDSYAADRDSEYNSNSQHTQGALDHMFTVALNEEKFEDAKEISQHFDGENSGDYLLARRAAAGDPEISVAEIDSALANIRASHRKGGRASFGASMGLHRLVMGLARRGHEPSVRELQYNTGKLEKQQASRWRRSLDYGQKDYLYQALYALHEAGDPTALQRLEDLARSDEDFGKGMGDYYVRQASADPAEFARLAYENDPDILSREALLDVDFSEELFREQVADGIHRLQKGQSAWMGRLVVKTAKKAAEAQAASTS